MNKEFLQNLREQIKAGTVTEQEPMNKHTSFAIGGPADVFVQPATREEIRSAVYCAKEAGIPFFVMGNGSNLLVSDEGFRGMIIQIGKNFQEISVKDTVIEVQAGALLSRTARAAWNAGLTGFEFAAGIPGSVGGAVAMNAGAYGGEVKDVLLDAEVLTQEGEFLTLTGEELDLSYRHSCIFEKNYVVLSARFSFEKGESGKIKARMDELAQARREKQPLEFPSAGSTFKRPAIPPPITVARYLYSVTLIPAASAVAGLSPTAFKLRPQRVLFKKNAISSVIIIAKYVKNP